MTYHRYQQTTKTRLGLKCVRVCYRGPRNDSGRIEDTRPRFRVLVERYLGRWVGVCVGGCVVGLVRISKNTNKNVTPTMRV